MGVRAASFFVVCALVAAAVRAAPVLAPSSEPLPGLGVRLRLFANARPVPSRTPEARQYRVTFGDRSWTETCYVPRDLWLAAATRGRWQDRKGNVLVLGRVSCPLPAGFPRGDAPRKEIEDAMAAAAFKEPDDAALAAWGSSFSGSSMTTASLSRLRSLPSGLADARLVAFADSALAGAFFRAKEREASGAVPGPWDFALFAFVEPVRPADARRLVASLLASVASLGRAAAGPGQELRVGTSKADAPVKDDVRRAAAKRAIAGASSWWFSETPDFIFLSDLPRSHGQTFMRDVMAQMTALRAAYEAYVPPSRPTGTSVVRIFAREEDYRAYLRGDPAVGAAADWSAGLWNPGRDELLVMSMGERRQTFSILRHEAFHQYLSYAMDCGEHAMWFNEGHACFFENAVFDRAGDRVKITDKGPRADWVAAHLESTAAFLRPLVSCGRERFYSGDINAHYAAAWALVYFLEKGAPAVPALAPYRKVLPAYLAAMRAGRDSAAASAAAWATVADRDLAADFISFWSRGRNAARAYEPSPAIRAP